MNATRCIGAGLLAAAMALAGSGSYGVKFYQDVRIAGTDIKAGDYKIEMHGDMAAFKSGKDTVEIPGSLQTADKKFTYTAVHTSNNEVNEIDIGGTASKLVFAPGQAEN